MKNLNTKKYPLRNECLEHFENFIKTMEVSLGWTPLHCMVEQEQPVLIGKLLKQGLDVNAYDNFNRTPLSIAAAKGNAEIIELLLQSGARISDRYPLHYACEKGNAECVSSLIKNGADINEKMDGTYPIIIAAAKAHLEVVKVLVDQGACVLAVDKNEDTALHWACETGNTELMSFLVDAGCDVNARDVYELTPLLVCLIRMEDRPDLVKVLLEKGSVVDLLDKQNYSVLHHVDNAESMLELIKKGADVNVQNINKETPLFNAFVYQHYASGKILLEHGADPNISAEGGWTCLHHVVMEGNLEYLEELIKWGADVNIPSAQNILPLHFAAYKGHLAVVKKLLDSGSLIDVPVIDIPDVNSTLFYFEERRCIPSGSTPFSLAAANKHIEVCKLLASYGASCKCDDWELPQEIEYLESGTKHINDWPCNDLIASVRGNDLEKIANLDGSVDVFVVDSLGWTLLHHSVVRGLHEMSQQLIKLGLCVDAMDKFDRTPLSIAAAGNDLKLLKLLLDNGADVNLGLPLHHAVNKNSIDCVLELINRNCDVNIKNKKIFQNTALIDAVSNHRSEIVRLLLEHDADPNCVNSWKESALHQACRSSDIESVRALIKYGADINAIDESIESVLASSVLFDNPEIVSLLLENGVNIHVKDNTDWTPLHHAVFNNNENVVPELIKAGVCVNAQTDQGETPLCFAEHVGLLKTLIDNGADLNICSSNGFTPLHMSACDENVDCVRELLDRGASINKGSLENILPIHLAAVKGNTEIVEELLKRGSFVDIQILDLGITVIRDPSMWKRYKVVPGNTPLIGAASQGHLDVVKMLHSHGASLETVNSEGNSALHEAILNNCQTVVEYLIIENEELLKLKNKNQKTPLDLARTIGNESVLNLIVSK